MLQLCRWFHRHIFQASWVAQPFGEDRTRQRARPSFVALVWQRPRGQGFQRRETWLSISEHFILTHPFIHPFVRLFSHLPNIGHGELVSQAVGIKSESTIPALEELRVTTWAQWWAHMQLETGSGRTHSCSNNVWSTKRWLRSLPLKDFNSCTAED